MVIKYTEFDLINQDTRSPSSSGQGIGLPTSTRVKRVLQVISLDSFGQGARSLNTRNTQLRTDADRSTEIEIAYTDLISLENQKPLASAVKFGTKRQQERKGRSQGRSRGSRSRDGSSGQKIAPRGLQGEIKWIKCLPERIDRSRLRDHRSDRPISHLRSGSRSKQTRSRVKISALRSPHRSQTPTRSTSSQGRYEELKPAQPTGYTR